VVASDGALYAGARSRPYRSGGHPFAERSAQIADGQRGTQVRFGGFVRATGPQDTGPTQRRLGPSMSGGLSGDGRKAGGREDWGPGLGRKMFGGATGKGRGPGGQRDLAAWGAAGAWPTVRTVRRGVVPRRVEAGHRLTGGSDEACRLRPLARGASAAPGRRTDAPPNLQGAMGPPRRRPKSPFEVRGGRGALGPYIGPGAS